jgi:hypothetical protein
MEISQGTLLDSYLKQTKMSFFFFKKIGDQDSRTGPVWVVDTNGREKNVERV